MNRRLIGVLALLVAVAACGSPVESAVGTLKEQVRLGDPLAQSTYQEQQELIESEEAVPLWIETLRNDEDAEVRKWAAQILGSTTDSAALPALTEALSGPREVREAAANAIHQYEPAQAAEAFADALTNGTRDAQALALAQISRLDQPEVVPAVVEAAASDDDLIAGASINTLGDLGGPEAAEALAAIALDPSRSPDIRSSAITNLGRLGADVAGEHLDSVISALEEDGGEVAEQLLGQARSMR